MATIAAVATNPDKKQLNLWLPKSFLDELAALSKKYRFRGRTEVAVDVLEHFLGAWVQMQERLREFKADTVSVLAPVDSGGPAGRVVKDIEGALESEQGDVADMRPATEEEVEQAHGPSVKGGARKGRR